MPDNQDIVIGIDGGGTHTRVMISDLQGNVLSYLEKGSASVYKDLQAQDNVKQAVTEALAQADKTFHHVCGLAAGIAGYDSEDDLEWVKALTDITGLTCPQWHFNDAVAAHFGALLTQPGIVALSGTGSIVMALTENGSYMRNYDFHHYTSSAARFIAYEAVYEVLAGNGDGTDMEFIQSMLTHWNVHTLTEFHTLASSGFFDDRRQRDRKFEQFTPLITAAACAGSTIARQVSDRAIHQLKIGIELLAPIFMRDTVDVVFIGSVINSSYFKEKLTALLHEGNHKKYKVTPPCFSPVTGSVLYAISQLPGYAIQDHIIQNLQQSIYTRV